MTSRSSTTDLLGRLWYALEVDIPEVNDYWRRYNEARRPPIVLLTADEVRLIDIELDRATFDPDADHEICDYIIRYVDRICGLNYAEEG